VQILRFLTTLFTVFKISKGVILFLKKAKSLLVDGDFTPSHHIFPSKKNLSLKILKV